MYQPMGSGDHALQHKIHKCHNGRLEAVAIFDMSNSKVIYCVNWSDLSLVSLHHHALLAEIKISLNHNISVVQNLPWILMKFAPKSFRLHSYISHSKPDLFLVFSYSVA